LRRQGRQPRHAPCSEPGLTMDEQTVREHATAHCEALRAGDIGQASQDMSRELQANLGPLVAMLPLPLSDAEVEGVEMTGTAYRAVLRLTGESGETVHLETRWKDRDGRPTIVEASRLSEEPEAAPETSEPPEPPQG
jgi:hypothetical protein